MILLNENDNREESISNEEKGITSTSSPNFIEFEQRHCPFLYRLKRRQHRKNAFSTVAKNMYSRNIFDLCGQISSCIRQEKQYL